MKNALGISFCSHIGLAFLILSLHFLLPNRPTRYIPTLKVDLVALPDLLKKDLNSIKQAQLTEDIKKVLNASDQKIKQAKRELLKKNEMGIQAKKLSPQESSKKNLLVLKRMKSLERMKELEEAPQPSTLVKGNKISPGTSLSGDAKEAMEANYYDLLRDRLQSNWALPPWIARQNLTAQIRIYLDAFGNLKHFEFIKQSSNQKFDEAAANTIRSSSPFPAPPDELSKSLLNDGILIGFPL